MDFSPIKGTRDFYPDFQAILDYIFEKWSIVAKRYGFLHYDGPELEPLDLYKQKSGDEIETQLYAFEDKGGREISLRPEITPTLARLVIATGGRVVKPLRWYSYPRLFRYEKPQKGRLREFFQFNIDVIGENSIMSDIEVISCAIDSLKIFGLTSNDFVLKINNRAVIENILVNLDFSKDEIAIIYKNLDKKGKVEDSILWENLKESLQNRDISSIIDLFNVKNIEEFILFLEKYSLDKNIISPLTDTLNILENMGLLDYVEFDISVVRGLAYYTDVVFEMFARNSRLRAIAGGGRYDSLIAKLSDNKVDLPAVGFGIGDAVLYELLKEKNLIPENLNRIDCYGVYFGDTPTNYFFEVVRKLRESGKSVIYSLSSEKVGKQFKNASKHNADSVFIIGDDEEKNREVKIKDFTSGKEYVVSFDDL